MLRYYIYLIIVCVFGGTMSHAQTKWEQHLGAVEISRGGEPSRVAVLRLGAEESITLDFDVLGRNTSRLSYKLRPCNRDMTPSALSEYEALEQSPIKYIWGEGSLGSDLPYMHYRLMLPNSEVQFRKSGVYRLDIVAEDNAEKPILTMPIYVHEGLGELNAKLLNPFESYCGQDKQGLRLSYALPQEIMPLRSQDLVIQTLQNASNLLPRVESLRADGEYTDERVYSGQNAPCFPSGNRYIPLEHRDRRMSAVGVERWERDAEGIPLLITPLQDYSRPPLLRAEQTSQGIQRLGGSNDLSGNGHTRGEYHLVRFSLLAPRGLDIYLEGAAFDYLPNADKHLIYNDAEGVYSLTIPLKQGYQEYRYIAFDAEGKVYPLEGDYYATENGYTHFIYYKDFPHERLLLVVGAN